MEKTIFEIPKMDCPTEERMIRMKLEDNSSIFNLEFDLDKRILIVFHQGNLYQIDKSLAALNLGSNLLSTAVTEVSEFKEQDNQRKTLWIVLTINLAFFIIELSFGFLSKSMGLVADSLDMLSDAFVYGISLLAVGSTIGKKKKVAQFAGYSQLILAIIGFSEVVRRFLGNESIPDFSTMLVISFSALVANAVCISILQQSKSKNEIHMKASLIFTSNDVIINFGVILAALFVKWFNSYIPDLIIGTFVLILVFQGAFRILKLSK